MAKNLDAKNNQRVRVKFCGMTDAADAAAAAALGADAIGFIFHPPAKTAVPPPQARAIRRTLPPFVAAVAVFYNASADAVRQVVSTVAPDVLQFHGEEPATFCEQFGVPYIKTCRIQSADDLTATVQAHPNCRGVLVDTFVRGVPGGSGKTFDWSLLPSLQSSPPATPPLIVAGGLAADNVADAITTTSPYGVDVSSGIAEPDDPRRKNYGRMAAFMSAVRSAAANA